MKTMAILTDVTKCIGCEECVAACERTYHTGADAPYRWQVFAIPFNHSSASSVSISVTLSD